MENEEEDENPIQGFTEEVKPEAKPQRTTKMAALEKFYKEERGLEEIPSFYKAYESFEEGVFALRELDTRVIGSETNPLNRKEVEFLLYKAAEANECEYCIQYHMCEYEGIKGTYIIDPAKKKILEEFAFVLTKQPEKAKSYKNKFEEVGYTISQHQHAAYLVSLMNMAKRLVFAMDIQSQTNICKNENIKRCSYRHNKIASFIHGIIL